MNLVALTRQGLTKEQFIQICKESKDVNESLIKTNLHQTTFIKYAKYLECYFPTFGKGITKDIAPLKFNLDKWNNDDLIDARRVTIRKWIFKLKLLPIQCNNCKLDKWLDKEIPLELNHINGNGHENRKSNIELLCPNCHALTDTYRGKNVTLKYGKAEVKPKDKNKQSEYNKTRTLKKDKKPNKWHSYDRTREEYIEELKEKNKLKREETIKLILESNIDFTINGWRLKLSNVLNKTPQHSGNFIKNNLPDIWSKCWKHCTSSGT